MWICGLEVLIFQKWGDRVENKTFEVSKFVLSHFSTPDVDYKLTQNIEEFFSRESDWSESLELKILLFEIPYREDLNTYCEIHTWHRASNLLNNSHLSMNRQPNITRYLRNASKVKKRNQNQTNDKKLAIENG